MAASGGRFVPLDPIWIGEEREERLGEGASGGSGQLGEGVRVSGEIRGMGAAGWASGGGRLGLAWWPAGSAQLGKAFSLFFLLGFVFHISLFFIFIFF